MTDFGTIFALLVAAHALCDYPLQGDFLARAKNPSAPLPGVPWWWAMGAHCVIHAGVVWLVTGSLLLAVAEVVVHWATDVAKCRQAITFTTDQCVHLACKAVWAAAAVIGGGS